MSIKINQLDLFSGIGGFHLGFERAGFEVTSYFSEIDKHAVAVYQHKFKDATYVGSVTDVRGADLPNIDLITFGSPCQDFSLAGKRKGMDGERSSLILEAIRLITECQPRAFVWENVKGTFSSNDGEDFAAILQAFSNIGGYRLEWQLLNTSWFLPQNRERIYLVGYSTTPTGDWGGVFPIGEGAELSDQKKRNKSQRETSSKAEDSIARALPAHVGYGSEDTFVEVNPLKIKVANKKGYQEAEDGDAIRLYQPNSETQRGRVGKGVAHTLETTGQQGVVNQYRIRRLTPIECERLQGFPDNHTEYGIYDGEVKKMSNTQRYKQCGNAVTVDVVKAVAQQLIPIYNA